MLPLLGVIAVLGTASVARTFFVADEHHWWFNPAVALVVVGSGVAAGLRTAELGLAPAAAPSGLRLGAAAMAVVALGVVLLVAVPAGRDLLADDRAHVDTVEMLWRVVVVIPLGTVLLEELVFRGVVVGLANRSAQGTDLDLATVVVAALVFGAWHVLPAAHGAASAGVLSFDGPVLTAAGTMVATTAAGAVFAWLRLRSGSLLAPMAAHVATNSFTFVAAWWVVRH